MAAMIWMTRACSQAMSAWGWTHFAENEGQKKTTEHRRGCRVKNLPARGSGDMNPGRWLYLTFLRHEANQQEIKSRQGDDNPCWCKRSAEYPRFSESTKWELTLLKHFQEKKEEKKKLWLSLPPIGGYSVRSSILWKRGRFFFWFTFFLLVSLERLCNRPRFKQRRNNGITVT